MGEVVAASGNLAAGAFVVTVRVYYEDTDAAGIVYHSNYLNFAERARTELLRAFGDDHAALRGRFGIAFVVSKCDMHCLSPARLDEMIEVRTSLNGVGGATIDLQQDIWRDDTRLVRLRVLLACINADGRAVRVPTEVRQRFVAWGNGTSRN